MTQYMAYITFECVKVRSRILVLEIGIQLLLPKQLLILQINTVTGTHT